MRRLPHTLSQVMIRVLTNVRALLKTFKLNCTAKLLKVGLMKKLQRPPRLKLSSSY